MKVVISIYIVVFAVSCITILGIGYFDIGADFIKVVSFILQIVGITTPLYFVYRTAYTKLPEFRKRELVEDSKSSHFDFRRGNTCEIWRNANHDERKILDLQYKIDDLNEDVKHLKFEDKVNKIWFNVIWNNFTYMSDYLPRDNAREQFNILF